MKLIFNKKSNQDEALPSNLDWCLTSGENFSETCILPNNLVINNRAYQYGIYHNAFYGETNIEELVIPASIKYIGVEAFARSSIKVIKFWSNTPPQLAESAFAEHDKDLKIYVPAGTKQKYYTQNWILACGGEDQWQIMMQEGDYAITDNQIVKPLRLFGNIQVTEDNIENNITEFGLMPYIGTEKLQQINIDNVQQQWLTIEDNERVYWGPDIYRNLDEIEYNLDKLYPPGVIKPNAFYNNKSITYQVNAPRIESLAFQQAGQTRAIEITIGPNVEYISPHAFKNAIVNNISIDSNNKYYQIIDNNLCDTQGNIIIKVTPQDN